MAASSKTPPHQSKSPQKFKTPLQVPVFPGSSLLCRHNDDTTDSTSFHSVLVCHRTSSQNPVASAGVERIIETGGVMDKCVQMLDKELWHPGSDGPGVCIGVLCANRTKESPVLDGEKVKSPALIRENMRGEPWLERTGRER
ncbi:hypothetical protein TNCV_3160241 [Trichonephila clavipes]|nr:hypothetical protein TNCV_3160241 [Trichonephila clavipes]